MYKQIEKKKIKKVDRIEVEVGELDVNNYQLDIMFFDKKNKFLGKELLPHLLVHQIKSLVGEDIYKDYFEKLTSKKIAWNIETRTCGADFTIKEVQFKMGNEIYNLETSKFERVL